MVEVLQNWEVGWKSPNRGWERTKYVPELKWPLVYKSVYFSATIVSPIAITNHQICPYTWLYTLFQDSLTLKTNSLCPFWILFTSCPTITSQKTWLFTNTAWEPRIFRVTGTSQVSFYHKNAYHINRNLTATVARILFVIMHTICITAVWDILI
jgi:hypothetical protein